MIIRIVVSIVVGLLLSIVPVCMISIAYDVQEIYKEFRKIRQTKKGDRE